MRATNWVLWFPSVSVSLLTVQVCTRLWSTSSFITYLTVGPGPLLACTCPLQPKESIAPASWQAPASFPGLLCHLQNHWAGPAELVCAHCQFAPAFCQRPPSSLIVPSVSMCTTVPVLSLPLAHFLLHHSLACLPQSRSSQFVPASGLLPPPWHCLPSSRVGQPGAPTVSVCAHI